MSWNELRGRDERAHRALDLVGDLQAGHQTRVHPEQLERLSDCLREGIHHPLQLERVEGMPRPVVEQIARSARAGGRCSARSVDETRHTSPGCRPGRWIRRFAAASGRASAATCAISPVAIPCHGSTRPGRSVRRDASRTASARSRSTGRDCRHRTPRSRPAPTRSPDRRRRIRPLRRDRRRACRAPPPACSPRRGYPVQAHLAQHRQVVVCRDVGEDGPARFRHY